MKIAVLGCGSIGSRHIRNLITLGVPAEDITALDVSRDALDRLPDGVWREHCQSDDMTSACIVEMDARLICTPAAWHARHIRDAISDPLPKPFFVEKPATLGVSELTEAEWQTDVPHLVACNMRFRPEFQDIAQDAGAACRLWIGCPSKLGDAGPVWENCHEIDIGLQLFGTPLSITAGNTGELFFAITCERGTAFIGMSGDYYKRKWERGDVAYRTYLRWVKPPSDVNLMYLDEMQHFLAVVRGEQQSINTLSQAKRVVEICEQAEKMASVSR